MNKIYLIAFLILFRSVTFGQVFSGTTAAQFLKVEAGAKSIAMGGAFVSQANDASALYWNPAGIAKLHSSAAIFTHSYWLAETSYDFAGVVIKINDQHSFGLSYTTLSMPDMPVRTELYPEGTGELFSASDYALGLSYGLNLTEQFSIGFTAKYIGQSIWHMKASAMAFDVGVLYETGVKGLQLGMSVSNIGSKMKYEGKDNFVNYTFNPDEHGNSDKIFADLKMDEWDLPLIFRVGTSMKVLNTEVHSFVVSVDANHPNDYGEYVNVGCEYGLYDRFFLRGGYKSLFKKESEEGLTAGVGLVYYLTSTIPLKVDYAFAHFGRLKPVHRFAIELNF